MPKDNTPAKEIADLQQRLAEIDRERADVIAALEQLEQYAAAGQHATITQVTTDGVRQSLSNSEKVLLFRSLFRGREDVFPRRWENTKSGKSGSAPVASGEADLAWRITHMPKARFA